MKRYNVYKGIVSFILGVLLCATTAYAQEGPKIKKYEELVILSKDLQTLRVQVDCISDPEGFLYLPGRGKLILKEVSVKGAELKNPKGEDVKLRDLSYFRLQVDKSNTPINVTLIYEGKDIVKEKTSKLGETYPGRVTNYTRTFINTTPLDIAKYSITLKLPEGKDIYNVTKPAKYEDLQISLQEGIKTVTPKTVGVKAGGTFELVLDVCEQPSSRNISIWIVCIGLAGFFLIKRKDILSRSN